MDPSGHGFFSSLKRWFPTLLAIAVGIGLTFALGPAGAGVLSTVQAGIVGGAAGGFVGGLASGAGLKGALLGAVIGGIVGGLGAGLYGCLCNAGFSEFAAATISAGAAGAVGGALSAVVSGQNVLEGAIIGGLTGAAFAAAMYGVGQLFKGSSTDATSSATPDGLQGSRERLPAGLDTNADPLAQSTTNASIIDDSHLAKIIPEHELTQAELSATSEARQQAKNLVRKNAVELKKAWKTVGRDMQKSFPINLETGTVDFSSGATVNGTVIDSTTGASVTQTPGVGNHEIVLHARGYRATRLDLELGKQGKTGIFLEQGRVRLITPQFSRGSIDLGKFKYYLKP